MPTLTDLLQDFAYARGRYFKLHKHRDEKLWARLLISSAFALFFPTFFMSLGVVFGDAQIGLAGVLLTYLLGFFIAFSIHGSYRAVELLLPEARLQRLNRGGPYSSLFFGGVPVLIMAISFFVFTQLLRVFADVRITDSPFDSMRAASRFLFISLIFALLSAFISWQANKRKALQLQATEAQLLRLQAQIEPHFLFNSLAAVQSLIDPAPERAKQMLECFTDYLRASLGTLRLQTCSLDQELQAVQSYLALMQIRMGEERLQFHIDVPAELRALKLPPLLLQPLVENAVTHGLEGKAEGGTVRLSARLLDERLHLRVEDDGLGLRAAQRRARPGHGLALKNIRERLDARHGDDAALTITPGEQGCVAELVLPIEAQPTSKNDDQP
ncbi:histidine kinase [Paucibacter sp. APW11]|uniref:Histidine kinase n=1 Tax=Roseateles aquae TaxID=3077235 RepID=A0ABU3P866_9BURK|nr:histidine kinase [Paucibacter sp. APW11]MDT8998761.1 histidine kinase [Paucibacter sp. APW11]